METSRRKKLAGIILPIFLITLCLPLTVFASGAKWPSSLTITTKSIGSTSHTTAAAWAPVMDKMTGMKVRVVPQSSTALQARGLRDGQYDLWTESAFEYVLMMEGRKSLATRQAGPFQLRVVWLGQMAYFVFFVRGDSPIKTVYDLKPGVRVGDWTVVPGFKFTLSSLLAWANVKAEEAKFIPFSSLKATIQSVSDGKSDITYCASTSPDVIEAASKPHGLRFIALDAAKDPEGAKRYLKISPTHTFGKVEAGVKPALGTPTRATPWFISARADLDAGLVYNTAKWLHENYDAYKDKHQNCRLMSMTLFRSMLDTSYLPLHEGTIKYLREIGMWTAADDKRQKYNVDLVDRYVKAYEAAIAEADQKKIKIDPKNEEWMAVWKEHKKALPHFKVMLEIP